MKPVHRSSAATGSRDPAPNPDARTRTVAPSSAGRSSLTLEEALFDGAMLGRYRLVAKLGDGGMGVVYEAFDPKLARNVAIKLMRSRGKIAAQRRFAREAQAMARLSHPNVVQIYEIGEVGTSTFIVMELVEGQTLGAWLRERPRPLERILEVFTAAGHGLSAAHDAGLIHRDFKPDNVMIRGDGRVMVMDFGLARRDTTIDGSPTDVDDERLGSLAINLTSPGMVMGTPAYMAPEQFLGRRTDARTDQFSFCVALWEAIHKQRPFAGADFDSLSSSVVTGSVRELALDSPLWLRRILRRGLCPDPERRWPSMDSLLGALRKGPRRRRIATRAGLGLFMVASVSVTAALGFQTHARSAALQACNVEARALDDAWDGEVRADLEARITASAERSGPGHPESQRASWDHLRNTLDSYTDEWSLLRERTCTGADLDGTIDPIQRAHVFECLDERRASFTMLLDAWRRVDDWDARAIAYANRAAATLPDLASCEVEGWLAGRIEPPSNPVRRGWVQRQRVELERAKALQATGDDRSLAQAEAVLAASERFDWRPLAAEARLEIGAIQSDHGHYPEALETFRAAYLDAIESGHELAALAAAIELTSLVGEHVSDHDGGRYWGAIGTRLIARGGLAGTLHEAQLLNSLGLVLAHAGDYEQALADQRRALEIEVALLGPDHYSVGTIHNNIGSSLMRRGDFAGALASHTRAREIWARTVGSTHPDVGLSWNNIAVVQLRLGHDDLALTAYRRALDVWALSLDEDHPWIAKASVGVAQIHADRGEDELALAGYERSLAIWERSVGPEDAGVAHPLMGIAAIHARAGDHALARTLLERALRVREDNSADPERIADTRLALARSLAALGDTRRATKLGTEAIASYRALGLSEALASAEAWASELER